MKDKYGLKQIQSEFGKLGGSAAGLESQLNAIRADFNKYGGKPVLTVITAASHTGGSGGGWRNASITLDLEKAP